MSRQSQRDETIEQFFRAFDTDHDGIITLVDVQDQVESMKGQGDVSGIYTLLNRNEHRLNEKLDLQAFTDMVNVKSLDLRNPDDHPELFRMVADQDFEKNHLDVGKLTFGFNEFRRLVEDVHGKERVKEYDNKRIHQIMELNNGFNNTEQIKFQDFSRAMR